MDRVTIAALLVAGASVIGSLALLGDSGRTLAHALVLGLPILIIAFPEEIDAAVSGKFPRAFGGHGNRTPGSMIRIAAWIWLVVLIAVYHTGRDRAAFRDRMARDFPQNAR